MSSFTLTNKAVDDLAQIWNYSSEKWSEEQADRYYFMLLENCREVAHNPDLGKYYSGITEDLIGFKAGRHIIFYRKVKHNAVEIIRILHEQMDIENRIKGY